MSAILENKTVPQATLAHSSSNVTPLHSRDQATLALLTQSSQSLLSATQKALEANAQSSTNPILEALLAQIQCEGKVDALNREVVNSVLNSISAQINQLQDLQSQIAQLEHELAGNLSPAEIEKIEEQIEALQQEYDQAINQQQQAQSDKSRAESENKSLEKENEELQREAAAAKDPKVKQQLEDEIKANNQKITQNNSQIQKDDSTITQTNASIQHVDELLQALEGNYPAFKGIISEIISGVVSHQNVDALFNQLNKQLSDISSQDIEIASQISSLQSQLSSLESQIAQNVSKTDAFAASLEQREHSDNQVEKLIEELKGFVHQMTQEKSLDKVQDHFKVEDLKLRVHLADQQLDLKRGLTS